MDPQIAPPPRIAKQRKLVLPSLPGTASRTSAMTTSSLQRLAPATLVPSGYPARAQVPAHLRRWEVAVRDYAPPNYTATKVIDQYPSKGWADQPGATLEKIWQRLAKVKSFEGEIQRCPETGLPRNPRGRTGICGRGDLGFWGPTFAADRMLVRPVNGALEALLIKNRWGLWALPGGMMDPQECPVRTAGRELLEETCVTDPGNGEIAYRGHVPDRRETDNVWMETALVVSVVPADFAPTPHGADDAQEAAWHRLTPEFIQQLSGGHPFLVRCGLTHLVAAKAISPDSVSQLGLAHEPLRTELTGLRGNIGIFGGSFDPPHFGHLLATGAAQKAASLDAVLFFPTPHNPLKAQAPQATWFDRLQLTREAIAPYPSWFVSPVQGRQPELRYTIDLLREIKRQSPTANLSLIIGADCLAELTQWRSWQELPQLTKIIAVARSGFDLNSVRQRLPGTLQGAVTVVPTAESPLSSSGIRKERNLAEKTPSEVADFARELGLYC